MRYKFLLSVLLTLTLVGAAPACTRKKAEPTPAPTGQAPEGEQAQAQGTADTAKAPEAPAGDCTYSTDPKSITMQWTAYKHTEKTPVKGSFTTTSIEGPTSAGSLAALAQGLSMELDGSTVESGDPGRNVTLKDFFFSKFNPPSKLSAKAKGLSGSDTAGTLTIEIGMNGATKDIPFAYTATDQGDLDAKAEINMMDWQLKAAFDSLHSACEDLHKGKDGVSKTWETVDLELKGKFTKTCGQAPAAPAAPAAAPSAAAPGPQGP